MLVAKITPCFENGKIAQASVSTKVAFGSTEFHVLRPIGNKIDRRYLLHFLRQPSVLQLGEQRMTGAGGQRRVPARLFDELEIPLPPIEEQRRIAAVLDAADALRAKRRQALAKLDTLTQAIFIDMFGGLGAQRWTSAATTMADLLAEPLRNGVSPAKSGKVEADVLTLSAITGRAFDPSAVKRSTFTRSHSVSNTVSSEDFLICRGNGNLSLVGRGRFPDKTESHIAFPDTMIAARCDQRRIGRQYLELLWNGPLVRRQLESLARTTNGTYKINQTMIESVEIPLPPIELQTKFDETMSAVSSLRSRMAKGQGHLDALFASLQQRAFRGEL